MTWLQEISDIQNGVFAISLIHRGFDPRRVVILKIRRVWPPMLSPSHLHLAVDTQTPNPIISTILQYHERSMMPEGVLHPTNARNTLHWLRTSDAILSSQTTVMLRLTSSRRSGNRRIYCCTITMVWQPSSGGDGRWMSSPNLPRPFQLKRDRPELSMAETPPFRSVMQLGMAMELASGTSRLRLGLR